MDSRSVWLIGPSNRVNRRLANELTQVMQRARGQLLDETYVCICQQVEPCERVDYSPSLLVYPCAYWCPMNHTFGLLSPSNHRMVNGTICSVIERLNDRNGAWSRCPNICLSRDFVELSQGEIVELASIIQRVLDIDRAKCCPNSVEVYSSPVSRAIVLY